MHLDNAEEVNKPYKQKVLFARIRELSDTHASSDTIVLALIQLQQYTRSTLQQALAKSMTVEMYNRIVSNNDAWLALATITTSRHISEEDEIDHAKRQAINLTVKTTWTTIEIYRHMPHTNSESVGLVFLQR